jgi:hypothetical protein
MWGSSAQAPHLALMASLPSPQREVLVAVDLSPESAHALQWACEQFVRPGDRLNLLHIAPCISPPIEITHGTLLCRSHAFMVHANMCIVYQVQRE